MKSIVLCIALIIVGTAASAETRVYRWTDENGVIHFSNSPPPGDVQGVEEEMVKDAPAPGSIAPSIQVNRDGETGTDPGAPQLEDLRARRENDETRRINCERARQRVAAIEPAQRVRVQRPDGSEEWLYGENRIAELDRQRQLVRENCKNGR